MKKLSEENLSVLKSISDKMNILNGIKNLCITRNVIIFSENNLKIRYTIDREYFDYLNFIYKNGNDIFASFRAEPKKIIDLKYLQEDSLIAILNYIKLHSEVTQEPRKLSDMEAREIQDRANECYSSQTNDFYKGVAFIYEYKTYYAGKPNVMIVFSKRFQYGLHVGRVWALWGKYGNVLCR